MFHLVAKMEADPGHHSASVDLSAATAPSICGFCRGPLQSRESDHDSQARGAQSAIG
jgi:hypothetical protein